MSLESQFIRAFVAIELPEEIRSCLGAVQSELQDILPRHSTAWSKPHNIHLTLRFLGNVSWPQIPHLQSNLSQAVAGFGPLDLICERLGCFPDLRYPRVVWAGVHDAKERLQQLQHRVSEAAREFAGKPADEPFVGHITLARPKQIKRPDAERLAGFVNAAATRTFGNWHAREILLLRSELASSGSTYHELARARLG